MGLSDAEREEISRKAKEQLSKFDWISTRERDFSIFATSFLPLPALPDIKNTFI